MKPNLFSKHGSVCTHTALNHVHWNIYSHNLILTVVFLFHILMGLNYNMSKPKLLKLLWDIVVFRLVEYLLNMIWTYIYDTVLNQFLKDIGTSDITFRGRNLVLNWLAFSLYIPPFILPLRTHFVRGIAKTKMAQI